LGCVSTDASLVRASSEPTSPSAIRLPGSGLCPVSCISGDWASEATLTVQVS
jgi:hypothetical protein